MVRLQSLLQTLDRQCREQSIRPGGVYLLTIRGEAFVVRPPIDAVDGDAFDIYRMPAACKPEVDHNIRLQSIDVRCDQFVDLVECYRVDPAR